MNKPKTRPLPRILAAIFVFVLVGGLGTAFYASGRVGDFAGPTHIAAGEPGVYLFLASKLIQLDQSGKLIASIPADVSGLDHHPIDIQVIDDNTLLLAQQRPARIRLCALDSWRCETVTETPGEILERQFKLLRNDASNDWLATDAFGDMVWQFDQGTTQWHELLEPGTVAGPNGLAFDEAGHVWVADTDNRRIIELLPADEAVDSSPLRPGRTHSAVNDLTIGERFYPMMLSRANDNRWWVTQAAEVTQDDADLVIYHPQSGAQAVVSLPAQAYPTDIVALGNTMLVTDSERFAVYQIDQETLIATEFGDSAFTQYLGTMKKRYQFYRNLSMWAPLTAAVLAVVALIAVVIATPKGERFTRQEKLLEVESAPAQTPPGRGIHWLERDPRIDRALRWGERIGITAVILMFLAVFVAFVVLWGKSGVEETKAMFQTHLTVLLSTIALMCIIPVVKILSKDMKLRLGTDGKRIFIRDSDERVRSFEPSDIAYNDRMIFIREHALPLHDGRRRSIYSEGEVNTWISPLLRNARKLGPADVFRHQWTFRKPLFIWFFLIVFLVVILLIIK